MAARWSGLEIKTGLLLAALLGVFAHSMFQFERLRQDVEKASSQVQVSTGRMALLGQLIAAANDPALAPDRAGGTSDESGRFRAQLVALDRARSALDGLLPRYQYDGATYARLARSFDAVSAELALLRRAGSRPTASPGAGFEEAAVSRLAADLMAAEQGRGQEAASAILPIVDGAARAWLIAFLSIGLTALAFCVMAVRQIRSWRKRAGQQPAEIHLQLQHGPAHQAALQSGIETSIAASLNNSRTIGIMAITLDELADLRRRAGAEAADLLVTEVAKRLRAMFRPADLMARADPDTIVAVLADIRERDDIRALVRRVRESIDGVSVAELGGARLSPRIGTAMYPIDGYSGEELIATARASMTEARDPVLPDAQAA